MRAGTGRVAVAHLILTATLGGGTVLAPLSGKGNGGTERLQDAPRPAGGGAGPLWLRGWSVGPPRAAPLGPWPAAAPRVG